ncbi:MAG: velvet factor, partial [Piptocephalis tieghemiana]
MSSHPSSGFRLVIRQQPRQARLCSFKEKVDRRPIDPPPIIQIVSDDSVSEGHTQHFLQSPYYFMFASLVTPDTMEEINFINENRTTAGTVVQSLFRLKDIDNQDGGFFIFPDMSVRIEGHFRLKFSLFQIVGRSVLHLTSIHSDTFRVFSPKAFPGMSESTFLTRSFSDQGVRIRIRKENRVNSGKR